jgi:hypothetical protein
MEKKSGKHGSDWKGILAEAMAFATSSSAFVSRFQGVVRRRFRRALSVLLRMAVAAVLLVVGAVFLLAGLARLLSDLVRIGEGASYALVGIAAALVGAAFLPSRAKDPER